MSNVIQLEIPYDPQLTDYSVIKKLKPEDINLSLDPNDFRLESVEAARLPLGTVLEMDFNQDTIFLTISDVKKLRESPLIDIPSASLCAGNMGEPLEKEDGTITALVGNYLFLYWGKSENNNTYPVKMEVVTLH